MLLHLSSSTLDGYGLKPSGLLLSYCYQVCNIATFSVDCSTHLLKHSGVNWLSPASEILQCYCSSSSWYIYCYDYIHCDCRVTVAQVEVCCPVTRGLAVQTLEIAAIIGQFSDTFKLRTQRTRPRAKCQTPGGKEINGGGLNTPTELNKHDSKKKTML